ncbi:protein-disulfide reductase DsbD [Chitinibacter bivalviorum]|uniref:Protein-disulfide reductase DsbD n=1 Tax=Chitinibacter bivalviorum TaxID=2739434 RepID=A0A7H9BEC1_9NEIS|nr:protein-disulfide reductase DsbD [Chitinibacter bivalviorum]QLG86945.1 protein-disulfide reductase DsbD [Chitinibacter bivalviorum]
MNRFITCLLFGFFSMLSWANADFLPPEKAFRATLVQIDDQTVEARFTIAPGYYLYRDRIKVSAPGLELSSQIPAGEMKDDPSFGKVSVFHNQLIVKLTSKQPLAAQQAITLKFQGCAEAGICYPPQTQTIKLGESKTPALKQLFGANDANNSAPDQMFFGGSFFGTLGIFFLAGIGLALTACMYPLIPIVSGIVIGQKAAKRWHAFSLTFVYVQGMAISYTAIGVAAAATGTLLVVALQQPWVIALFALFFVAMALSMFGLFNVQLPSALQSKLNNASMKLPGGKWTSVLLMGLLSALIIGPCIAPPLAAALAYIGQTGDLLLGGAALYAMALGLGSPLLAIGAFGSTILPKISGGVMKGVKIVFGVVLLAMAIWVSRPLWEPHLGIEKPHALAFQTVRSTSALDQALAQAKGKPVMVDFYADWCVSCIEFERNTLSQTSVQTALQGYELIRVDVTANSPDDAALLARFKLYGPPALIFYGRDGKELANRVIGYQGPDEFLTTLKKLEAQP